MAAGAQEKGFLVMRRPRLKGAETLTLIINATLGFSFHSACTVSPSLLAIWLQHLGQPHEETTEGPWQRSLWFYR